MTTAPPIGMTFASLGALGVHRVPELARISEELGYGSFWTAEASGPESFATLGAVAVAAPSLDLGTGIMPIQVRSPLLTAMGAATLQALHPTREVLVGVGVSSPVITQKWHGVPYEDRPLAQTREYLALMAEILSGESVTFEGEYFGVKRARLGVRMGDNRPKMVLAALNPGMLSLAGEAADGVLLNYIPASHVGWSVEHVRKGEAKAGREPGSCTVYAYVHVGVCERTEKAVVYAQRDLYGYAMADGYAKNFERAGYVEEIAGVRAGSAAKDRDAAIAAISDRMVDGINTIGDSDTVAASVAAYRAAGVDVPVVMALPWGEDRWQTSIDTLTAAAGA